MKTLPKKQKHFSDFKETLPNLLQLNVFIICWILLNDPYNGHYLSNCKISIGLNDSEYTLQTIFCIRLNSTPTKTDVKRVQKPIGIVITFTSLKQFWPQVKTFEKIQHVSWNVKWPPWTYCFGFKCTCVVTLANYSITFLFFKVVFLKGGPLKALKFSKRFLFLEDSHSFQPSR